MRASEMEGERPLGDQRPALAIVCLLFVGTIAIAAPNTNPIPTPLPACTAGHAWPAPSSSVTISTNLSSKSIPWINREIKANGIPNHCVENAGYYNKAIAKQYYDFKMTISPSAVALTTKVTVCKTPDPQRFGVALNGVPFDPEDVAIWTETPTKFCGGGKKKGGCIDNIPVDVTEIPTNFWEDCKSVRWQVDPETKYVNLSSIMCCPEADLKMDDCFGHTQDHGQYHYHKLTDKTAAAIAGVPVTSLPHRMTLVGWAFDGFPVYWKYGTLTDTDKGDIITMTSSWTLKKARDAGGPDPKGGFPLGTFVNDYEYTKGKGTLDECNGRYCYSPDLHKAIYCYFLTEEFPYIPRCLAGGMARTILDYDTRN